ncbi:MAG: prepilin peptidase [Candidatus Woesearchaeota archaeon]
MLFTNLFIGIFLLIASITDLKKTKVKNKLIVLGFIYAIIQPFVFNIEFNIYFAILSAILYFLILFFIPSAIGLNPFMHAGDVKLFMVLSLVLGWKHTLLIFAISIFISLVYVMIFQNKKFKDAVINLHISYKFKTFSFVNESRNKILFAIYIFIAYLFSII